MRILKWELNLGHIQTLEVPKIMKVLSVKLQGNTLVLYLLHNDSNVRNDSIEVAIIGTGHLVPKEMLSWDFLDTVDQQGFMWHVFTRMSRGAK